MGITHHIDHVIMGINLLMALIAILQNRNLHKRLSLVERVTLPGMKHTIRAVRAP